MYKYFFMLLLCVLAFTGQAQETDSIFAVRKGTKLAIKYTVQTRETLKMLSHRFFVPEATIEKANEFEDLKRLTTGTVIYIPVLAGNFLNNRPSLDGSNFVELYYRVSPKDDITIVSSYANVTKTEMRTMNSLKGNTLTVDQVLFMGWVKMITKDSTNPSLDGAYPVVKKKVIADTPKVVVVGGLDTVYNRQTNNGMNVLTEKGTAVFFENQSKSNMFYAFHNATPRGTVIKVFNPGNGKAAYVKVLGPIPDTKLYSGSIIGISDAAREALGAVDTRLWCELTYTAN